MSSVMTWTQKKDELSDKDSLIYFSWDPGIGFSDIDSHPIKTEQDWKHMKSPNDKTVAVLRVSAETPVGLVIQAIDTLSSKGAYKTVKIQIEAHSK